MADDPTIAAARANIDENIDELRTAVAELSVEQLNTRPVGETSNPIGVIVVHALASTRSWLALALGERLPDRDRPSEFRTSRWSTRSVPRSPRCSTAPARSIRPGPGSLPGGPAWTRRSR